MTDVPRIVGYVLTLDEEDKIAHSLTSLQRVADRVVVIDSGSTDATREVATRLGADFLAHPFSSFPAQRNWAIDQVVARHAPDFIVTIDADEWLTDDLVAELRGLAEHGRLDADVYMFHLRIRFDGRDLRWGGFANTWLHRLFRPHAGRYGDRIVNEHLILEPGTRVHRWPHGHRLGARPPRSDRRHGSPPPEHAGSPFPHCRRPWLTRAPSLTTCCPVTKRTGLRPPPAPCQPLAGSTTTRQRYSDDRPLYRLLPPQSLSLNSPMRSEHLAVWPETTAPGPKGPGLMAGDARDKHSRLWRQGDQEPRCSSQSVPAIVLRGDQEPSVSVNADLMGGGPRW